MRAVDDAVRRELAGVDEALGRLGARFKALKAELLDVARELRDAEARRDELRAHLRAQAVTVVVTPCPGPVAAVTVVHRSESLGGAGVTVHGSESLGSLIKAARKNKGLEVKDAAWRVGVTNETLYAVEGDRARPSYKLRRKLAELLELDYDRLCTINPPLRGRPVTP